MRIEPATVEQIRQAGDGRFVLISADASSVAADLRRIDKGLKVRFAENGNPPFWCVYHESDDGRQTHLVLTVQAYQTASGTWAGLDQRVVKRIERIDPQGRGKYHYADELEKATLEAKKKSRERFHEQLGELGEHAAHALRKDLGERYKGRSFFPDKPNDRLQ
jgi:hypothetical protein